MLVSTRTHLRVVASLSSPFAVVSHSLRFAAMATPPQPIRDSKLLQSARLMRLPTQHFNARSQHPEYVAHDVLKAAVRDAQVPWTVEWKVWVVTLRCSFAVLR